MISIFIRMTLATNDLISCLQNVSECYAQMRPHIIGFIDAYNYLCIEKLEG